MMQCEAPLKRLQTDRIDLYQIHRPQLHVPIDETLQALDDLIRQGKVRYIGTSGFAAWELMESLTNSKELKLSRFVSEQPPYNVMHRRIERELIPFAPTGKRNAYRQVSSGAGASERFAFRGWCKCVGE